MSDVLKGLSVPQLPVDPQEREEWEKDITRFLTDTLKRIAQSSLVSSVEFTPSGTSDVRGSTGTMAYDDTYIYIKTPTGWKRSALGSF